MLFWFEFRPKVPIEETVTVATNEPMLRAPDEEDSGPVAPAKFVRTMKNADVIEGSAARFDVQVTGNPEPEVKWLKDGKPLKENRKFRFDEDDDGKFSLFVTEVEVDDEGLYKCVAFNNNGEASCEAELLVEGQYW